MASSNEYFNLLNYTKLNALYAYAYVYTIILVKITKEFKARITKGYYSNLIWVKILGVLYKEVKYIDVNAAKLSFLLEEAISKEASIKGFNSTISTIAIEGTLNIS